jgi:hypothetical protein
VARVDRVPYNVATEVFGGESRLNHLLRLVASELLLLAEHILELNDRIRVHDGVSLPADAGAWRRSRCIRTVPKTRKEKK